MNQAQRRERVLNVFRRRNRYQFGQPKASLVSNSGCTDTCIQMIVLLAKDKNVSLNEVRARSGCKPNMPMSTAQALRALGSFGLPYQPRTDLQAAAMLQLVRERGPVILCEKYWAHPQWKDYTYMGRTLRGAAKNDNGVFVRPGYSRPLRRSGLTQWTFRGGHAVLVGTDTHEDDTHWGVVRDPNHNSPARPERPAYDLISLPQLNRMLNSYGRLVLVPTRVVMK